MVSPPENPELQSLYKSGPHAKAILEDFAGRVNFQRVTKVDQIMNRLRAADLPRSSVITVFRKLDELRHGKFVEGRKGHPSRFVWSSNPKEVGKAAKGEDVPITRMEVSEVIDEEEISDTIAHQFPLRPGHIVTIDLPSDLTEKEALRLGNFLKTLALSED